jgi:glycerol-3-phosphate acyltransferase PlsX
MKKIVLDAMGGDLAPANEVAGALLALQERPGAFEVILVGDEGKINEELKKQGAGSLPLSVVHADEVITMHDPPTAAVKTKKNSSIAVGMNMHRDGKADAFASAGNTGAMLSASTLILGRIRGVSRPTIGAFFPSLKGVCILLDAGTNVDCRPQHLLEFAVMGSIYASQVLRYGEPTVGLLSVGEEDSKGSAATVETNKLLRSSRLNFIGNIEGRDILAGKAQVIVCDGFVGNIILKFGESVPSFLKSRLRDFAQQGVLNKLRIGLVRTPLRRSLKDMDYEEVGGVPVLGVNGVSIVGHGSSTPKAIKNMLLKAYEVAISQLSDSIEQAIATLAETTVVDSPQPTHQTNA